jgi:AcrR family transcriptional regulator
MVAPPLTRDSVIEAARQLIATEGLDGVSLRRLAATLGVTAPALYAYVTDKEDLLRGVAEGEFDRLILAMQTADDADPVERLRQTSRAYVDHALARPELFRTMFLFAPDLALAGTTGHELPKATVAFATALELVSEAIAVGALHPTDPTIAALTLWTATHGVATVLLMGFPFDQAARDLVIDSVIDTTLAGLGARSPVTAPD